MAREQQLEQLAQMIFDAAFNGKPCPTNLEIAAAFGYASSSRGAALILELEKSGRIFVERHHQTRVVTLRHTTIDGRPVRTLDSRRRPLAPAVAGTVTPTRPKPRISAAVIRAARIDGRDLYAFATALIDMGLDCWRDDRAQNGEAFE